MGCIYLIDRYIFSQVIMPGIYTLCAAFLLFIYVVLTWEFKFLPQALACHKPMDRNCLPILNLDMNFAFDLLTCNAVNWLFHTSGSVLLADAPAGVISIPEGNSSTFISLDSFLRAKLGEPALGL